MNATVPTGAGAASTRVGAGAIAGLALLAATILAVHAPAIAGLRRLWDGSPMYSYGYLVPFVSAFLVWSRWRALRAARLRPSPGWGAVALAAWVLLYVGGRFATVALAEQVALVVAIVAAVLLVWGTTALRIVWAAVAYLLLMVPLWDGFTEPLHPRFQQLSATLGVQMLEALGIPAHRDGTFITLPNLTLEVARACSGVNYLIAVLALGLPLGYLYLRTPWRRVALIVSALIIAALSNSLRVALIGILVYLDIGVPLHGPGHVLQGLFVSGIGYVALFVGLAFLRRGERAPEHAALASTVAAADRPSGSWRTSAVPMLALCAVCWLAAGATQWWQPSPIRLANTLERLPVSMGGWTVDPYASPAALDWWNGADDELRRTYRRGAEAVDVHVAYFHAQRPTREVVTYRASDIHRAARIIETPFAAHGLPEVNLAEEHLLGSPTLTLFWYELDGDVELAPSAVKLRTLWHALGRRRSNGAVVCLRTAAPEPAARAARLAELIALADGVHRGLSTVLPGRPPLVAAMAGGAR